MVRSYHAVGPFGAHPHAKEVTPMLPRLIHTTGAAVPLWCVLLVSVAWAEHAWETIAHDAGILVERRREPETPFYEVRASTHSPFPPSVFFATLWKHEEYIEFVPHLKKLEILTQSAQEKILYEQIRMPPLVADRDYTVKVTADQDATTGVIQMRFVAAPHAGPPAHPPYVRITSLQGSWTLEPTPDGGSAITYVVASHPGGALPAWIITAAQSKAIPH